MINYSSLIGFTIGIMSLGVFLFFLIPKQYAEVLRPKDWLTNLSWIILTILVIGILTAVPGVIYQYFRIFGHDYKILRNISTITSNISKLANTILLVLVYTYRQKD